MPLDAKKIKAIQKCIEKGNLHVTISKVDLAELGRMPLERVVEVHVSGLSTQAGIAWDDHAAPAPALVFELLAHALVRARPRAVTIEYNWSPQFPAAILCAHTERTRRLLAQAGCA